MRRNLSISLLATLCLSAALPAAAVEIKLATYAPENSPWYRMLAEMGEEWSETTSGRVKLTIYAGGVSGDESDIIRKIRIGQLHGGALTVNGLTDLDESFSIFEVPLFFDSWDELNYVLDDLTPTLVDSLDDNGFVWLTWGHVGWVHFFTKQRVERLDDLRKLKIWTWAGNDRMVQWWKGNGFQPVALALPDALQGLKTGMIETMISPPLAAMTLQWFKEVPYMIDVGLVPMVGAIVVSRRAWNRVDEADRPKLLQAARRVGAKLAEQVPKLDSGAVKIMEGQGLEVLHVRDSEHSQEWLNEAHAFAEEMRGGMVPAQIFDRAKQRRDAFRAEHEGASGDS